ncbi:hypothetical protein JOE29_003039 [Pseudomonas sp. PvP009]|jgi:hypothetical protein|uniref:hypothetical protein n=1 Tax=Pseudomonas sp. PvP009 TaxID=2806584 RepID=UPI001AE61379|nr:hypothetical protein [Pseudomonas sp. PvP009]MBP1141088.1 hypothetical protein [Pseudomonas sp. PvP009]
MQNLDTIVIDEPSDVQAALAMLGLTKEKVVIIAKAAVYARAEYLPGVDPINFPGTRAYQAGIRQLRLLTYPDGWRPCRYRNIELVYNESMGLMFSFQNVDHACQKDEPRSISSRGEATRELVGRGYEVDLFGSAVPMGAVSPPNAFPTIWYICTAADERRLQVEVSRPKPFEGDQFEGFHERIFIEDQDLDTDAILSAPTEPLDELDTEIVVTKKKNGNI